MTTPEALATLREALFHVPNASVEESAVWNAESLAALTLLEQRLAELEKERDEARRAGAAVLSLSEGWQSRAEAAESRLAAYERVVEAARNHVDMEWASFCEYGEPEKGDQPPNTSLTNARLAAALAALKEQA